MVKLLVLGTIAVEVALLAWFGAAVGFGYLLAYFMACFFLGILVMRIAGAQAFRALADPQARSRAFGMESPDGTEQVVLGAGGGPVDQVAAERAAKDVGDSSLLFGAGILLAVPGVLSTLVGLVMLLPPVRSAMTARLGRRLASSAQVTVVTVEDVRSAPDAGPQQPAPRVISGEILPPPARLTDQP